jgi:hypothetical protein
MSFGCYVSHKDSTVSEDVEFETKQRLLTPGLHLKCYLPYQGVRACLPNKPDDWSAGKDLIQDFCQVLLCCCRCVAWNKILIFRGVSINQ